MRILLCLMGLLFGAWTTQAAERPPNIILFVVDDLGWSDPGFMGNPWHETPAMDQLAQEGAVFTQAYAPAPVCRPSRASLLTGLYPTRHQIYSVFPLNIGPRNEQQVLVPAARYRLQPSFPSLARLLKARGYTTALIGKWDLGVNDTGPEAHGFEKNRGGFQGGSLPQGFFSPYGLPGIQDHAVGEYLTDRLGREAGLFIEASKHRPFFLMLSHYGVHLPLEAPTETIQYFRKKPKPHRQYNATYAAMLKHVDDSLLHIREILSKHGLANNTMIILTSDNGGLSSISNPEAPLHRGKSSFFESGIRVPLVMHWPEQFPEGKRLDTPTNLIDIVPTVLAITSSDTIPTDGINLLPCLQRQDCSGERMLFWHFPGYIPNSLSADFFSARPQSLIRQGPWKLIESLETGVITLFNLLEDPLEEHDIASREPEIAARLLTQLKAWQADTAAPMPAPNPDYRSLRGWPLIKLHVQLQWERIRVWLAYQWINWKTA